MQRRDKDGGVIISCDFCGTDWDAFDPEQANPMIEGHKGSVLCLACLRRALSEMSEPANAYACTMCLREGLPTDLPRWFHPAPRPSEGLNETAVICRDCVEQAADRFHKDPDIEWTWEGANR